MAPEEQLQTEQAEESIDAETTEVKGDSPPQVSPEVLERARIHGWAPKEEFRGDPKKWEPADVWVDRTDKVLPIARAANKCLESELAQSKKEIQELRQTTDRILKTTKTASERAYKQAMTDIRKRQAEAITSGDAETWEQLEVEKDTIEKPASAEPITPAAATPAGASEDVVSWKAANPWYSNDPELGTYADVVSDFISKRNPGLPDKEFLSKVKDEVKRRFPEKFNSRPAAPNPDGSNYTGAAPTSTNKKTYTDLPKDAKEACNSLVGQKLMTKEQYIKEYFEEDE